MGSTSLVEMVNSVFAKIDEDTASTQAVTSKNRPEIVRAVDDINDAYSDIWKKLYGTLAPQSFDMITTQAGVPTYPVSSDTTAQNVMLCGIVSTASNYTALQQSNLEELSRLYVNLNQQGTPTYWYRYESFLGFYPCPNQAMDIRVVAQRAFVKLTAGSDTTVLPDAYDLAIQHYAVGTAKLFWKDPDAQFWLQKYTSELNEIRAYALRQGPERVWRTDLDDGEYQPIENWLVQG